MERVHVTNIQITIGGRDEDPVTAEWDIDSQKWSINGMVFPRHMKLLWQIIAAMKEADG